MLVYVGYFGLSPNRQLCGPLDQAIYVMTVVYGRDSEEHGSRRTPRFVPRMRAHPKAARAVGPWTFIVNIKFHLHMHAIMDEIGKRLGVQLSQVSSRATVQVNRHDRDPYLARTGGLPIYGWQVMLPAPGVLRRG